MAELDPALMFWAVAAVMLTLAAGLMWPVPGVGAQLSPGGTDVGGSRQPAAHAPPRAAAIGLPVVALALYAWLGDPAALNAARAGLSEQLKEGASTAAPMADGPVYAELERHLLRQPGDARAQVMKARLDMQAQRYELAAAGLRQALEGPSKVAGDARVWVEYAEALGMLQGGTLAGQPRQLVEKALSIDPTNPQALDLAGSAAWEARDFAAASAHWKRLLAQLPASSPRHAELAAAIERAEHQARFALPPARR